MLSGAYFLKLSAELSIKSLFLSLDKTMANCWPPQGCFFGGQRRRGDERAPLASHDRPPGTS